MSADIAIAAFRLKPAGGLERHALRLAETLAARGCRVTLYTTRAGEPPQGVAIRLIRRRGLTNQGRLRAFAADLAGAAGGRHDLIVGFQKMPGLDMLVCCDWSYADRAIGFPRSLLPRHRAMMELERACCGPGSRTRLVMLAAPQAEAFRAAWNIDRSRITVLPPTLDRRRLLEPPSPEARAAHRAALGVGDDRPIWLWIGLQPRVKGLDRAVRALALSPGAVLFACGADPDGRGMRAALALADRLGCRDRVVATGSVEDAALERLFLAADLLIHPARLDVTGTVIVEALGAGLPVIVTDNCGYAPHVEAAGAGRVLPRAAAPEEIARAADVEPARRAKWSAAASAYARSADLTSGIAVAADLVEAEAALRGRSA